MISARTLMYDFARRTGLIAGSGNPKQRYLWTDAFAVQIFFALFHIHNSNDYRRLALKLIDEVVQSFVEFFGHLMVLLKDTEDVGCLPRDCAERLRHEIAPCRAPRTGVLAGFPLNFPVYKASADFASGKNYPNENPVTLSTKDLSGNATDSTFIILPDG